MTVARPDRAQGAVLTVDLQAIAANTRLFASRTRGEVMAVVKADGFGHGGAEAARTALANRARWLGVTSIAEALALREAGLAAPVLSWLNPVDADFGLALTAGIDLAVLGRPDGTRMIAPALEIAGEGIFGYQDKYGGQAGLRVSAALSDTERTALETAAVTMFTALGCAGVARTDFFLTPAGPVLNEVNTMPGFTEHSQVPKMFASAGLTYPELLDLLVSDALSGPAVPL